jgi:hypothetical protein
MIMSNIRFNTSRKTTIILLFILFLLVGGTGGYLLWRVNQQKTVAPTDSEAEAEWCEKGSGCSYSCIWPQVAWCLHNKCTCRPCNSTTATVLPPLCEDAVPGCTPNPCPSGYEQFQFDSSCEAMVNGEAKRVAEFLKNNGLERPNSCENDKTSKICMQQCGAVCKGCENPYLFRIYCVKKAADNVCDAVGAEDNIVLSPTIPNYCAKVDFSYTAGDTDGVGKVTVTLDGVNINFNEVVVGKTKKITGTIPGDKNCNTDEHILKISWVDIGGNSGSVCSKEVKYSPKENICDAKDADSAITVTPNASSYETCRDSFTYRYKTGDTDGVKADRIKISLRNAEVTETNLVSLITDFTKTPPNDAKNITVEGTLNTSSFCLTPGAYILRISWEDIYGAGGDVCKKDFPFTIVAQKNPAWDIAKKVVEECIDDGTENPIAKLTYTILITNKGDASGTITSVVDKLDSKVVDGSVTDISDGGVYSHTDRTITWGSFQIAAGGSKELSYSFTVKKDAFGLYDNVVTAKPSTGSDLTANASIEARCNVVNPLCGDGNLDPGEQCDPPGSVCTNAYGQESTCNDYCTCPGEPPSEKVPETGIFDDSRNIVIMGAILLFLGLGWSWITESLISVRGKMLENNRSRFEKRISKR